MDTGGRASCRRGWSEDSFEALAGLLCRGDEASRRTPRQALQKEGSQKRAGAASALTPSPEQQRRRQQEQEGKPRERPEAHLEQQQEEQRQQQREPREPSQVQPHKLRQEEHKEGPQQAEQQQRKEEHRSSGGRRPAEEQQQQQQQQHKGEQRASGQRGQPGELQHRPVLEFTTQELLQHPWSAEGGSLWAWMPTPGSRGDSFQQLVGSVSWGDEDILGQRNSLLASVPTPAGLGISGEHLSSVMSYSATSSSRAVRTLERRGAPNSEERVRSGPLVSVESDPCSTQAGEPQVAAGDAAEAAAAAAPVVSQATACAEEVSRPGPGAVVSVESDPPSTTQAADLGAAVKAEAVAVERRAAAVAAHSRDGLTTGAVVSVESDPGTTVAGELRASPQARQQQTSFRQAIMGLEPSPENLLQASSDPQAAVVRGVPEPQAAGADAAPTPHAQLPPPQLQARALVEQSHHDQNDSRSTDAGAGDSLTQAYTPWHGATNLTGAAAGGGVLVAAADTLDYRAAPLQQALVRLQSIGSTSTDTLDYRSVLAPPPLSMAEEQHRASSSRAAEAIGDSLTQAYLPWYGPTVSSLARTAGEGGHISTDTIDYRTPPLRAIGRVQFAAASADTLDYRAVAVRVAEEMQRPADAHELRAEWPDGPVDSSTLEYQPVPVRGSPREAADEEQEKEEKHEDQDETETERSAQGLWRRSLQQDVSARAQQRTAAEAYGPSQDKYRDSVLRCSPYKVQSGSSSSSSSNVRPEAIQKLPYTAQVRVPLQDGRGSLQQEPRDRGMPPPSVTPLRENVLSPGQGSSGRSRKLAQSRPRAAPSGRASNRCLAVARRQLQHGEASQAAVADSGSQEWLVPVKRRRMDGQANAESCVASPPKAHQAAEERDSFRVVPRSTLHEHIPDSLRGGDSEPSSRDSAPLRQLTLEESLHAPAERGPSSSSSIRLGSKSRAQAKSLFGRGI